MRFKSIMSRIIFLHVVAVVVTAICLPLVLYWFLDRDVEKLQQRAWQAQAEALARHLTVLPDGRWSMDLPAGLRDQYSEAYGRYAYAVLDEKGGVLLASRREGAPVVPIDPLSQEVSFFEVERTGRTFSGANLRKRIGEKMIWVQVAEDLSHRDVLVDDVVTNFFQNVGWITVPALLLLLASDIVIFRRAVQPLLRVSRRVEEISPASMDLRLPLADIPREILPLVGAVNQALDRLEEGFQRQREFTADAAHELRTPLAVLRTRIETLPDKDAGHALHRDIEGMSRVVSQLLDAAEAETFVVGGGEKADLRAVCEEVAEFVAPLALAQGKAIALSGAGGPVWVRGNPEMLRRAARNLVENALSHTPEGTEVEVIVGEAGTVSVLDAGAGVPLQYRERLFERFWPRDQRRVGAAGLGLSIVQRIVDGHGGRIDLENRSTGGARFTLKFVLANEASEALDVSDPKTDAGTLR